MYHNNEEFLNTYAWESDVTARVLGELTDESLTQAKAEGHPSLGDIAWHMATVQSFLMKQIGLQMPEWEFQAPEGLTAAKIQETFSAQTAKVRELVAGMTPEDLGKVHNMFGQMDWPAWMLLYVLVAHEVHHRGQISVLMRQAGLTVPSIYGPNAEETAKMIAQMAEGGAGPEA